MAIESPRRRTSLDVAASMLDACYFGIGKTHMMSRCKMTSKQFAGYLDLLLKAKLLQIENERQHFLFRISSKGKDFLKLYGSMKTLME